MLFGAPALTEGHKIARTGPELSAMVSELQAARVRGFDFETSGLRFADGQLPIGFAVGYRPEYARMPRCWYVPVAHRTAEFQANPQHARAAFRDALVGADALVGHNLKFDLNMARADGWHVDTEVPLHDTLVQAHLIYEKRKMQLEHVAAQELHHLPWDPFAASGLVSSLIADRAKAYKIGVKAYKNRMGHAEVPVAVEGEYACRDVAHALLLDDAQRARAQGVGEPWEAQRQVLYTNEMLLVRAIADMEWNGQPFHKAGALALADQLDEDLARRSIELAAAFGVSLDWGNDNQVRDLLYKHLRLPVLKLTDHGQPSTDRAALLMLRGLHPGLEALGEYKIRHHVRTGFTSTLAARVCRDGRLHTSFMQAHVEGGRFSSRDPNFQNMPTRHPEMAKLVRQLFTVDPGQARVYSDYSQIELRLLAWITGCATFTSAYLSPVWERFCAGLISYDQYVAERRAMPEVDVHATVARTALGAAETDADWKVKRRAAKIINFGVAYGMGWRGLMANPELMLPEPIARRYFEQYHMANPEVGECKQALYRKMCSRQGGAPRFINWAGRAVHGPGLRSPDESTRAEEERSVFALLVQGSAAELTRFSLVRLWQSIQRGELPARLTSTVHDELQLDCAAADVVPVAKYVRQTMENFHGLFGRVPITVGLETSTTTWAAKKELHE